MKNTSKRLICLVLTLVMILGILPVMTLAADTAIAITSGTIVGEWSVDQAASGSVGPNKSYDSDVNTWWNPGAKDAKYSGDPGIVYTLAEEYDISKITLTFNRDIYFEVLVSRDGTNYDLLADVNASTVAGLTDASVTDKKVYNIPFKAAHIQYIKLLFKSQPSGSSWINMYDITVLGSASSLSSTEIVHAEAIGNWTTTQPGTSLSIFSSYDNSTSTRWNPGASSFAEDLGVIYTLKDASHVEKMDFLFSTDTAATAKYYINVFVSSDGSTYTPVAEITEDNEAKAYPDGTALCVLDGLNLDDVKYVKVIFTGRKSSTVAWVSLYDVNISSEGTDGADTSWMLPFFSGVEMVGTWGGNTENIGKAIDGDESTMWNPMAKTGWTDEPGIEFTLAKATDLQKLQFNFGTKSDGSCTYYFDLYAKKEGGEYTKVAAISPVNEAAAYKAIGSYYYCVLDGLALEDVTAVKLIFNGRKLNSPWLSLYEAIFSETGTSGLNTAWMLPPVSAVDVVGSWNNNQAGTTISVEQTIDGNTSTNWNPDALYSGAPGVVYTLTEAMDLNKLQFNFGSGNHYFDVYVSADGSDYAKIAEISAYNEAQAYTTSGDRYICTLDGLDLQDVQYVKVIFTGRNTGTTWLKVYEVTFSESGASGLDNSWILPVYGNVGIASANLGGTWANENIPALGNAHDGKVSTKWNSCATYSSTPSVVFTLDKYYDLSNISIALSSRYSYMDVAVSGNGTAYTSVASVTAENYTEYYKNGYICTIDGLEEGNVKYIKVTFTGDSDNNFSWMNFHEIGAVGTVSQVQEFICYHKNQTTTTVDATCKAEGSVTVTCDDCGETLSTETVPTGEHTGGTATCTAKKECTECGEEYGDVDSTKHPNVTNVGDCTATTTVECPDCHESVTVQAAHTGGEATCKAQAICDECGQPYGEQNPEKHNYKGEYDTDCEDCGFVRHIHAGTNATLGNSIDMNIHLGLEEEKILNYTPVVYIDGVKVEGEFALTKNGSNTYFVKVAGLAAKELNKVVTVAIYEGETLVTEASDSFAAYVKRVIESTNPEVDTEDRILAAKMALYATAAQNYFPNTSGDSVIKQLDEMNVNYNEFTGEIETFEHERVVDDVQGLYMGSNFDLEENITMNMYVRDVDYAVIEYTPYNRAEKVEMTIQAATCETSGSFYKFKIDGFVTADGAKTVVTAKFYKNGEAEPVVTVTDSMAAYVARNSGDIYDTMLQYATAAYNALP